MSKELKLYVPITLIKVIPGKRREKTKYVQKTTYIGVHNCSLLKTALPETKDIIEHMLAQRQRMADGGEYTSIKVSVFPDKFALLCKEIGGKMGGAYRAHIIDVVVEAGQVPIIQIQGNKAVEVIKPRFERTAPHRFERGS
jgi:hypothetical protein